MKIASKIIFEPQENGGLMTSFEKLTSEEAFAIGESGTDSWPFMPQYIRDELMKMQELQPSGGLAMFAEPNPVLVHAIKQAREALREKVLLKLFGEQFKTHRQQGSIADVTKHIRNLVKTNISITRWEDLYPLANKSILGEMKETTFANKVRLARKFLKLPSRREARNALKLPKPKKTSKIKPSK